MCDFVKDNDLRITTKMTKEMMNVVNNQPSLPLLKMATKFDQQYLMLNEYMCSTECPCWSPPAKNVLTLTG